MITHARVAAAVLVAVLLPACGTLPSGPSMSATRVDALPGALLWQISTHRDGDDLLTAGLGLAGLQSPLPPPFADPALPSAIELRRRAIWASWRGIADFTQASGFGRGFGSAAAVPGREFHTLLWLEGAGQPHRVMAQVPDDFDHQARCLVVTAASGSRGIYGASALASGWGLPRGCAVVHTDKAAGSDWLALPGAPDGQSGRDGPAAVEFDHLPGYAGPPLVAVKHAHSGDNPEADWGRHVRQAAAAGLEALSQAHPDHAPYRWDNTRVIAVGLSNGGGAVLRAAELDGEWLDGVVAVAPNILPAEGGRALYDVASEAALLMPCALLARAFDAEPMARPGGLRPPGWVARCANLHQAGLLQAPSAEGQAEEAYLRLREGGWSDRALLAGALSVGFDLWRSIAVTYASAYTRSSADAMPCGYRFAMLDAGGAPRRPTQAEQALFWSDGSGIPPSAGVEIVDAKAGASPADDPTLSGLICLRVLWDEEGAQGRELKASVQAATARLPGRRLPMIVIHGRDDGLVPEAHTSAPYVRWLRENGHQVSYWPIDDAQHFDGFLGLPGLGARYQPLLPHAYRALDALVEHLDTGQALPEAPER